LVDVKGRSIYHCSRTIYDVKVDVHKRDGRPQVEFLLVNRPCDTYIYDHRAIEGHVAFVTDRDRFGKPQRVRTIKIERRKT
jgi:hypothetical protein